MMNFIDRLRNRNWPAWTPAAVALLGLSVYLVQSVIFAHTTVSNLDEGAYLLKGVLFASGEYRPFDPGIWTNKAPLAFLIPGYVQALFGPGLRTGRYLAMFFGIMAVIGTWAAARRLSGNWLAAGAVWTLALSPAVIKYYSNGATQSTIACLLAWCLALTLGDKRPAWQLTIAGFLAGAMMLVRQNMLPVLPLLTVYSFWQHRWRGFWLLIPGASIVAVVHAIYWPDILALWTWIPLIQFPVDLGYTGGGTPSWAPDISTASRLLSVFQAFRFHFAALAGGLVAVLLWPRRADWRSPVEFRIALALLALFAGLVYMHSMAAIGQDYCVYCFAPYIAFFNVSGVLLLALSARFWNRQPSIFVQIGLILLALGLSTGMGYSAFEDYGTLLINLPAPRVRDLALLPGFVTWRELLANGFDMDTNAAKKAVSTAAGLLAGGLVTLLAYGLWRGYWVRAGLNFGGFIARAFLIAGIALSPLLHGRGGEADCTSDLIRANEENGVYLRGIIPPGSLVYWSGGLSMAPMLYLPEAEIFPAQINDGYAFIGGGVTADLYEVGLWNEEMNADWRARADFFIIEEARYTGWIGFFHPEKYDEFERTTYGTSCMEDSRLRIFRRK
jgi:hypothetical protein